ncbi:sensor histidine kinase [Knoellia sp. S7-12]|uniref:sensor histidine kinase n=1 Tax=Knoellia sp. S7-12 TaxID=3126698 RepID=UPI0033695ACE
MRSVRVALALLVAALAVAGALMPPLVATEGRDPFNDAAIALVVATYAVVGVVIEVARPGHAVGRLMLTGAALWGCGEALIAVGLASEPVGEGAALIGVGGTAGRGLGWLLLVVGLPLLFPDGTPPRYAARLAVAGVSLFFVGSLIAPEPLEERLAAVDNPIGLSGAWQPVADGIALLGVGLVFAGLLFAVVALGRRWRHGSWLERQQLLIFAVAFALPLLLLPLMATPWVDPWMFAVVSVPVPIAVAVALLQRRLYDVQLAANRSLTYVTLSVALAALYALVVGGVGAMVAGRGAVWLPWVAAGVVAVAFAPLRDSLQRGANRLIHGRWSAPAEVLAETGHRLSDAADGPALLRSLTHELVHGLGLDHAEITDRAGRPVARTGSPGERGSRLELTAYGAKVGHLEWSGGPLRERDARLLEDVARQMGGVVHSAGLVEALRAAQERLVAAREQERRRVRRDLHDGLGPSLAGLGFQVDTIANLLRDGRPVGDRLDHLQAGLRGTVAEVRRIVEGLRPPALDDLGLFGAVAELGHELVGGAGLELSLDLPPTRPVLPAAVEVVAYRVAQEALTNVVRHAEATTCRVSATLSDGALSLEVSDDGQPHSDWSGASSAHGVGLRSMSERADEIGGRVDVTALAHGTLVSLRLPLRTGMAS